jgi:hypothetical protein
VSDEEEKPPPTIASILEDIQDLTRKVAGLYVRLDILEDTILKLQEKPNES